MIFFFCKSLEIFWFIGSLLDLRCISARVWCVFALHFITVPTQPAYPLFRVENVFNGKTHLTGRFCNTPRQYQTGRSEMICTLSCGVYLFGFGFLCRYVVFMLCFFCEAVLLLQDVVEPWGEKTGTQDSKLFYIWRDFWTGKCTTASSLVRHPEKFPPYPLIHP